MSIDNAWDKEVECFWADSPLKAEFLQVGTIEIPNNTITTYPPTQEMVNHPAHYNQGGIECIDAIESALLGLSASEAFYTGNIIKYIWRWKQKSGIEDLKKIEFYLHRLMKYTEEHK